MERSNLEKIEAAPKEKPDDILHPCVICSKKGAIKYERRSLCAKHYIEVEDEDCLAAHMYSVRDAYGKLPFSEQPEIREEIKKKYPELYKEFFNGTGRIL
jgi:hypothetical protein